MKQAWQIIQEPHPVCGVNRHIHLDVFPSVLDDLILSENPPRDQLTRNYLGSAPGDVGCIHQHFQKSQFLAIVLQLHLFHHHGYWLALWYPSQQYPTLSAESSGLVEMWSSS